MKKILSILILGVLILSVSGLGAVATTNEKIEQEKITLSFSQLLIQEKDDSIALELDGANSILIKKDHYMVPTSLKTFTFPFGTEIESIQCIPKNIHRQELTKELMISPEPVIAGIAGLNEKNEKCENPISINVWYDYDIGCGLNGNDRCIFVKVQTYPVQYYPSDNTIEWAEDIEIEIKYKEPEQTTMSFDDEYSFIILTPTDFSSELGALINHKISRDISTKLVTLDEIYGGTYFPVQGRDDQEKIKYFIKDAIENWNTNYVLLIGGSAQFPTRTTHVRVSSRDSEIFVSDLYYADLYNETYEFCSWDSNENDNFAEFEWGSSRETDDLDLYPDVHLGRLACIDSGEVTACVNKIITYEVNEAYTQDWFTDIVVIGGDSFPGDDGEVNEGEYVNEAVISIMDGFIPTKLWATNGKLGGLAPTGSAEITNAINNGCGFIDFSGHGNTYVYATHPHNDDSKWLPTPTGGYYNSNIKNLDNGNELPIVMTGACSVGKFNKDNDCFSWSFVSNPNGGGIASCGATALGYAYLGEWVTYGLIEKISLNMFEAYADGAITFGEMWVKAINEYMSSNMDAGDYKTVEEWQPFGDPTLAIGEESLAPVKPDAPEGSTSGGAGVEYTYSASTTDPSGWVGPENSGQTASASHTWIEQKDYEIRVKAKDDHGVQSEWSDPLPISMPKNKQSIDLPFFYMLDKFPRLFPILRNILGM